MAGDWIKVEHATLDKPEVLRMAELLGIKRREMLGVLLDFFVWLDRNSCHGCVTHMSRMSLDDVTHMAGFAAALCDVGWASIDDETGVMTLKNWDRHNGNPAKTRALAKDRKVTQRSRNSHAESVTREEKRRVTTNAQPPNGADTTDPKKQMFDLGVSILVANGKTSESGARSLLAKLAKDVGDGAVSEKLGYLAAHPKVEPRSYLIQSCRVKTPQEVVNEKMRYMP